MIVVDICSLTFLLSWRESRLLLIMSTLPAHDDDLLVAFIHDFIVVVIMVHKTMSTYRSWWLDFRIVVFDN